MIKKYKVIAVMVTILATMVLLGCSKAPDTIKSGVYVASTGFTHLKVYDDRTFILQKDATTSCVPYGKYTRDGNKLMLVVDGGTRKNAIHFNIKGDTLIFQYGELAEEIINKGTELVYRNDK